MFLVLVIQQAMRMHRIVLSSDLSGSTILTYIISSKTQFSGNVRRIQRDAIDFLGVKYSLFLPVLVKLEFSPQILAKCSNMKFYENLSCKSRVFRCARTETERRTDRQTDMIKRLAAFRKFATAPKNVSTGGRIPWLQF